jgi:uncharacterized membrane protein
MNIRNLQKQHILIFLALTFASTVSMMLLTMRTFYTGYLLFGFLIWNLFLAWLPFLFAIVVIMFPGKRYVSLLFGALWLLFFPNAPYIVTDLLHLWPRADAPLWFDMILLVSFALTGLFLGISSLGFMQQQISRRFGLIMGWVFVFGALLCAGFGVYIGRFLRWNSWDVISNPLTLLADLHLNLTTPFLFLKTMIITGALTAVFTFTYLLFTLMPSLAAPKQT